MLEPQSLFGKKLLLITGKGGIGKTLVAAAMGQLAAASGLKTLLVESSGEDQLAPLFGLAAVGHKETQVAPNLSCINLSAPENFREYISKYLGQQKLFDKVFSNRVVQSFIKTIPGFSEVMMLGRIFYSCELAPPPRYDLVIFDGFASGHFLSLMTTPDAVLGSGVGGPLAYETGRVRKFLADKAKTGVIYVAVPEDLVVSECLDFVPLLSEKSPAALCGVILNRCASLVATEASLLKMGSLELAAISYLSARLKTEAKAIAELYRGMDEKGFASLPVWHLPELGAVQEPLPVQFASSFLHALAGPKRTQA